MFQPFNQSGRVKGPTLSYRSSVSTFPPIEEYNHNFLKKFKSHIGKTLQERCLKSIYFWSDHLNNFCLTSIAISNLLICVWIKSIGCQNEASNYSRPYLEKQGLQRAGSMASIYTARWLSNSDLEDLRSKALISDMFHGLPYSFSSVFLSPPLLLLKLPQLLLVYYSHMFHESPQYVSRKKEEKIKTMITWRKAVKSFLGKLSFKCHDIKPKAPWLLMLPGKWKTCCNPPTR